MPFPFPNQMQRFGPQMGPGPQFQQPPQFQQSPQFPPHFPPQFMPQNQMNQMNLPPHMGPHQVNMPPQMHMPPPQMQMQFQPPQARMQFAPQNMRFPQEQLPQVPAQMMTPPRPEVPQFRLINPAPQQQLPNFERPQSQEDQAQQPEVRIHLRRIQIPGPIGDIFPFLNNIQRDIQSEMEKEESPRQNVQMQQMPLAMALSKVGITPDDLRNIQRMAEEKFQEHIRELVQDEDNESNSDSDSIQSEEDSGSDIQTATPEDSAEEGQKNQESHQEQSDEQQPQILALGRSNFGRSLNPVQLPVHMTGNPEIQEAERADCKLTHWRLMNVDWSFCISILVVHPR